MPERPPTDPKLPSDSKPVREDGVTDERRRPALPRAKDVGASLGGMVGSAIDRAVDSAGMVGRKLGSAIGLGQLTPSSELHKRSAPGTAAGIEYDPDSETPPAAGQIRITELDYCPKHHHVFEHDDVEAALAHVKPEGVVVRWLNVDGLHPYVIRRVCEQFGFHSLAGEDVLHVPQRPKAEIGDGYVFVTTRMFRTLKDSAGKAIPEQVSFFLAPGLVVSFQQFPGDVFDPIRKRISEPKSKLRTNDASFLLYALIDAMVDHTFPILERYGDRLEDIEEDLLENPRPSVQRRIHAVKRELSSLRRVIWPMREVVSVLLDEHTPGISKTSRRYFRDVYDHVIQIVEIVETFREMASGLTDLYMSAVSNRMNEIMKVLTIMASVFIPITFLAGVYGMNFEHIPELAWVYSYPTFWGVCCTVALGLLYYFRTRGWIGEK